jgi:Arc/MetJ family transcription regulator
LFTARIGSNLIDDGLPAEAAGILGTTTDSAAVDAALEEAVGHRKGRAFPARTAEDGSPGT